MLKKLPPLFVFAFFVLVVSLHTEGYACHQKKNPKPHGSETSCNGGDQCQADLNICNFDLGACNANLGTCNTDLNTCNTDLTQAQGDLTQSQANLATCNTNLSSCTTDLGTCSSDLNQANSDLAICETDLATCEAQQANIAPVPQTGQTTSFATGDDGDVQAGIESPVPRFVDNGDGTVKDNLTHLTWLKDANCFGLRKWVEALSDANNLADGQCGLTDESAAGDWYLPNMKQFQSLIDFGNFGPALPTGHPFANLQNSHYWSSTTNAAGPTSVWVVQLTFGNMSAPQKDSSFPYVLAVRDGS